MPRGARDALEFHVIARLAHACRVDERDLQTIQVTCFRHEISRRARGLGDDGARLTQKRVEETGLPDIGPARDDDCRTVADDSTARGGVEQPVQFLDHARHGTRDRLRLDEVISLVWKIQRRFESGHEIEQARIERL